MNSFFASEPDGGDFSSCTLCPRMCRADRTGAAGFCRCGTAPRAARAALHMWEEPCISGFAGSGAVFFSGCSLRCCFCQNASISREQFGKELTVSQLGDIFLSLQDQGAHNINLVTAVQYLPPIIRALDLVRHRLTIPVVYNSGGYERTETIARLKDYIDIYLPDLKYFDSRLSSAYSGAADYFEAASSAIMAMVEQTGPPVLEVCPRPDGGTPVSLMKRGVIIRHMVLPSCRQDSIRLLHWMKANLPEHGFYLSLLSQYTPYQRNTLPPELNRRITSYEYHQVVDTALDLGLDLGYMQKKSSAKEEFTPPFDLEGLP